MRGIGLDPALDPELRQLGEQPLRSFALAGGGAGTVDGAELVEQLPMPRGVEVRRGDRGGGLGHGAES